MNLELEFLGTADARRVPVYGCRCRACERARNDPRYVRRPCSALIRAEGYQMMLDAGRTDLMCPRRILVKISVPGMCMWPL